MLQNAGFTITTASNGARALRLIRLSPPRVVILGRDLAELSRGELLDIMCGNARLSKIPVILLEGQRQGLRHPEKMVNSHARKGDQSGLSMATETWALRAIGEGLPAKLCSE
jgi:DNA-binding NtrC family response regulator